MSQLARAAIAAAALSFIPLAGAPAKAETSAAEVARLGQDLTPFGAEKAGNGGDIPAWTGGIKAKTSDGRRISNPFASDRPKFVIDSSNVGQYADKLSAGQKAMIERYPDTYKIPVYETRRTFKNPGWVYDAIKKEAPGISTVEDRGLSGLDLSAVPFPLPETGLEAIWNHIARYRTPGFVRTYVQAPVKSNGAYTPQIFRETIIARRALSGDPDNENTLAKFIQEILSPSQLEGNVVLVHEFIDQVKQPRAAWVYNAGQRRVRRAPNIAYDGPGTAAEGARTSDDFDMYNGAPNKYQWKLLGKREMYLPANSYAMADKSVGFEEVLGEKHLNQDLARYELRRAWVVEATLKSGERHIYGKRTFYLDEDSWFASLADIYDNRGELWRVREGHNLIESDAEVLLVAAEPSYDLQSGSYLALSVLAGSKRQFDFSVVKKDRDFTPQALRRLGRK